MSLLPTFSTHPRALQRIRDYTPAVGAIPNFLCACCGQKTYVFEGRKRVYRGWKCAKCAKASSAA